MDPVGVPYDPGWVAAFEAERAVLRRVLAAWLTSGVEHVGSTSVPGMPAKPVIDMLAGVVHLDDVGSADAALAGLGYVYRPHRPEARLFLRTDPGTGLDTHHLHLTEPGSALWVERLTFRDALRAHAAFARQYAAWKRQHATDDPAAAYDATKTPFVARVLAAHGVPVKPDHQRRQSPTPPPRGCTRSSPSASRSSSDTQGAYNKPLDKVACRGGDCAEHSAARRRRPGDPGSGLGPTPRRTAKRRQSSGDRR